MSWSSSASESLKHVTDSPATPQSRRRRWKQWAVGGLAITCCAVWMTLTEDAAVHQASEIQIGQMQPDVIAIMGPNGVGYGRDDKVFMQWGRLQKVRWDLFRKVRDWSGLAVHFLRPSAWPVEIRFDANGRVDRIKRGSEIIEAPVSQPK
jgi:hypothetical protein